MNLEDYPLHNSQRGWFARALYFEMQAIQNVILITADLGYKMFDLIQRDYPDRFYNVGASEQAMVGIAVGMALSGKIPFIYSITPFALYRPFEWLRNYVNHERIPIGIVGSGLDADYAHDGITHHAHDAKAVLALLPRIQSYFPATCEEVPGIVRQMVALREPSFLCLRR